MAQKTLVAMIMEIKDTCGLVVAISIFNSLPKKLQVKIPEQLLT